MDFVFFRSDNGESYFCDFLFSNDQKEEETSSLLYLGQFFSENQLRIKCSTPESALPSEINFQFYKISGFGTSGGQKLNLKSVF